MPITATSNQATTPSIPSSVSVTTTETPMRVYSDKVPINSKMRSFVLTANQDAHLQFIFQTDTGSPYDLTTIPTGATFQVILVEKVSKAIRVKKSITLSTVNAELTAGKLDIYLTSDDTKIPAVFDCVVQCLNASGDIIQDNKCIVYIEPNVLKSPNNGPPSILEIRLQLRDSSPEENLLLDGLSFSDEEIAIAVARPITYFNELHPRVDLYYTTANFPFRYHWIEGILGQLFFIAEEYQRKNNLQYNAGGVSINDLGKEGNYSQAGSRHWETFCSFCKQEKVKMNVNSGFRHIRSSSYIY